MESSHNVGVPELIVFEVCRKVTANVPDDEALRVAAWLRTFGVLPLTESIALHAAALSLSHKLGMADSIVLANALSEGAQLITLNKNLKTVWIWEGVVKYLTPDQIRQTMQCIAARSAKGSKLALSYLPHGLGFGSYVLERIGEPVLTVTPPGEFGKLAEGTGWTTESDTGIDDWRQSLMGGKRLWFQRLHSKRMYERIWLGGLAT